MNNSQKIHIQENYKNFSPPPWVHRSISRLIDGVPPRYIKGLHSIVLTNVDGLNHGRRRQKIRARKRKVPVVDSGGLYQQAWHGKPAVIELFIDNILYGWPAFILKVSFIQDISLAHVLYHEIGHHIHKTIAPEHRERERVAENWAKHLRQRYFRKKYPWIKPVGFVLHSVAALLPSIGRRSRRKKASAS